MRLPLILTFLVSALVATESVADACSPPAAPQGYIVGLSSYAVAFDDASTPLACKLRVGSCSGDLHTGLRKFMVVSPIVKPAAGTSADEVKVDPFDQIEYILKDGSGVEIERQRGFSSGTFSKLAATVCVHVMWDQADTGVPSDRLSDLCAPITVSSLDVTAQDQSQHAARIERECLSTTPDAGGLSADAGTVDGGGRGATAQPAAGQVTSGCAVASSSGGAGLLLAATIAFGLARRRRRDLAA
jgi:MYXO-CTERM domain-containing protein